MRLLVGNLPWGMKESDLEALFARVGQVLFAQIATEKHSGRSRGFGYVEMGVEDGRQAIGKLHGYKIGDIALTVTEAKDQVVFCQF